MHRAEEVLEQSVFDGSQGEWAGGLPSLGKGAIWLQPKKWRSQLARNPRTLSKFEANAKSGNVSLVNEFLSAPRASGSSYAVKNRLTLHAGSACCFILTTFPAPGCSPT